MTNSKLLPCPFCGCTDLLMTPIGNDDDRWYQVVCVFDGCAADGPLARSMQVAEKMWNGRSAAEPTVTPTRWPGWSEGKPEPKAEQREPGSLYCSHGAWSGNTCIYCGITRDQLNREAKP